MRMKIVCSVIVTIASVLLVAQTPPAPKIPLRVGLTVIKAFAMSDGDGESMGRVDAIDARGLHLTLSGEKIERAGGSTGLEGLGLEGLFGTPQKPQAKPQSTKAQRFQVKRTVLAADLQSARHLQALITNVDPPVFPGSTSIRISTLLYNELKTRGQTQMSCQCAAGFSAMLGGLGKALGGLLGGTEQTAEFKELEDMGRLSGLMKRVSATPVPFPVLVNDVRVELPAIHVKGQLSDEAAELLFLDDADNPMGLKLHVGNQLSQVVKIIFPTDESARPIATALANVGRADVYGIYFDFASDTIKPESEPVLKEIADVLAKNAGWNLGVEGHTDNVGGNDYNLDLSRRRAAAVKTALVSRHKIPVTRLVSSGFGASRPKDTNETLEGRARNRRVELVRQ